MLALPMLERDFDSIKLAKLMFLRGGPDPIEHPTV